MNKQIADDIKLNEETINTINNAIKLVEEKNQLSMFFPNKYDLESQKMKLEATNEVLKYYQSKLGDRERLETGRHLSVYVAGRGGLTFEVSLDGATYGKLYCQVNASSSDNYAFFKAHFYALSAYILNYDLGRPMNFFKNFGFDRKFCDSKFLYLSKKDFDKDVSMAKEHIDKVFKLFEDKKLMDRVEDVLDAYLNAVFESNPEEE